MEKNELRAVIKHFYLKKWTAVQIKAELEEFHGDSAPAFKTIYFWINEFKRGRTCTEDPARSGRPITTKEVIEKVHRIVLGDRRMKIHEIDLRRFLTVDETWIHHYTPESKNQSK